VSKLAADLPLVLGDATQMRQIIHNLLRNAEDAQENRELATSSRSAPTRLGHHAELSLRFRPGFPPEIMPRVFEPYVTTKARGTGLGLAIVKKIVDEHHGTIDITNRQQGGARIRHRPAAVSLAT
jgi:nitrogen fixation/metabolism regulation signal transduction histidine kinase